MAMKLFTMQAYNSMQAQKYLLKKWYSVPMLLYRVLIAASIAVSILLFFSWLDMKAGADSHVDWVDYVIIIVSIIIHSEIIIQEDNLLERFFPIPEKLRQRIFSQLFLSMATTVLSYNVLRYLWPAMNMNMNNSVTSYYLGIAIGLTLVTFYSTGLLLSRFMSKWVYVQQQIEEMEREKLITDYNRLQDQLNPHFLFNNLSVLKSLIMFDPDAALAFTDNFTDVYRYVLHVNKTMTVPLKDELAFISSYVALHKERLGNGLEVNVRIDADTDSYAIAPMSLQILIENCIKHNVTNEKQPLLIDIIKDGAEMQVRNTINKKKSSYSTYTGLNNVVERYRFLTDKSVRINQTDAEFFVTIPLLPIVYGNSDN